jgi:hypothetical protein
MVKMGTLIGDVVGCEFSSHLCEQNLRVCVVEGWNLYGHGGDRGCGRLRLSNNGLRVCKLDRLCQNQGRARDSGVTNVMLIKLLDMIIPKQHNICMSTEIHAMQRGVHVYVLHTTVCVTLA